MSLTALDAVYRSELGIEPPTSLTPRFLRFFGVNSVEEILYLSTSLLHHTAKDIGQLTPILLDEAQGGDLIARQVVQEHGRSLGNYALAAARKVGLEGTAFRLVLSGGVFRHPSSLLPDTIVEQVRTSSPDIWPIRYPFEPIIGVLFAALEVAQVVIDDALLGNLLPTLPSSELFATVDAD